jgi:5-methylcytosine-specific restriction endonuclease McrA
VSRGGASRSWLNTVAACPPCNQVKANRTPREAGMQLLVRPYEPKAQAALILALGIKARESLPAWLEPALAQP